MTSSLLRLPAAAVLALVLLGTSAVLARPAAAATVDCPPMSSAVCKQLKPVVECVWDNRNGTKTALWGWTNPTNDTARIAVGSKNQMSPGNQNQGQPTLFGPGTQRNVFVTTFTGSTATWRLANATASVVTTTPACATKPVPQVGNVGALLVAVLVFAMGALLALAARSRPRVVTL